MPSNNECSDVTHKKLTNNEYYTYDDRIVERKTHTHSLTHAQIERENTKMLNETIEQLSKSRVATK